jgi:hypothetical protein
VQQGCGIPQLPYTSNTYHYLKNRRLLSYEESAKQGNLQNFEKEVAYKDYFNIECLSSSKARKNRKIIRL